MRFRRLCGEVRTWIRLSAEYWEHRCHIESRCINLSELFVTSRLQHLQVTHEKGMFQITCWNSHGRNRFTQNTWKNDNHNYTWGKKWILNVKFGIPLLSFLNLITQVHCAVKSRRSNPRWKRLLRTPPTCSAWELQNGKLKVQQKFGRSRQMSELVELQ